MPNYTFIYHGGSHPESEAEVADVMTRWRDWLGSLGKDAVDPGAPVGMSKTVMADGSVVDGGGSNPLSGYSVISAKDMDDALSKSKDCPHLSSGGSIEIAEVIDMEM